MGRSRSIQCWSCSPPSTTSGVMVPSAAIGGTSAGSHYVLDALLFSWQAIGAVVSFYFHILFERLRVDSNASEVRTQLTVGFAPQHRCNSDWVALFVLCTFNFITFEFITFIELGTIYLFGSFHHAFEELHPETSYAVHLHPPVPTAKNLLPCAILLTKNIFE